ncbi:uncharacterized protein LACBIDRAFT_296256 [Laccaria bicolor S238N-H82]|uniref:Predicted protein n=1 Tax=Laccaria bicolor (strain S238N-H82 / ATCC MYA-4686) TaxID=486041 RepID=B0D8C1_LACBS|nr:uncharacterized protein LACBIDRAFT_296256 [Laccaria bicolor S238N-H82]EDR08810.1 predicted protein [Laccaria bicolor S238N-H82]|eukprot:XP_001880123.1 predicted protein [Laccaria bicolor S238N-H82]
MGGLFTLYSIIFHQLTLLPAPPAGHTSFLATYLGFYFISYLSVVQKHKVASSCLPCICLSCCNLLL